ncbi:MAG: DMT family transporter [Deltaproteobacteria bacterium]|nr:MAG: DMT family transporter [Deltaproteobacteria bacterium]
MRPAGARIRRPLGVDVRLGGGLHRRQGRARRHDAAVGRRLALRARLDRPVALRRVAAARERHTSATNTALLIALNPVFTLLLSPLVGEPLDRHRLGGVSLALAGATVVITAGDTRHLLGLSLQRGDLLAVAAAGCWALFNLASRPVVARLAPAFTNCVVYGLGGLALYGLARADAPWAQLAAATPAARGGVVLMALLSSVMAGQLFLVGVRTVGVGRTVVFVYLVPVLTAVLSTTLLGEPFRLAQAVGGSAVLGGVYWTTRG